MKQNRQVNNLFHDLPLGPRPPYRLNAVIEIEKGGKNKYEYDKQENVFKTDRVLYGAVFYPTDYGFLPQTWSIEENDPLDVMVLCTNPSFTGCVVEVRVIGLFMMIDRGVSDHKIIAVAVKDPRFNHVKRLRDLGPHFKIEIKDFWENYAKLQPSKKVKVLGWGTRKQAWAKISSAHRTYLQVFKT